MAGSGGDAELAIRSPAKNRLQGNDLMPDDAIERTGCMPLLFERASSNWWNPQFDSEILETQHERNHSRLYRQRFRNALIFVIIACISWAIFFSVMSGTHWISYLAGAVIVAVITSCILIFTFTSAYEHHSLLVWMCTAVFLCFALLLSFVWLGADMSPVGAFASSLELILVLYTLIPLPLYLCISIAAAYSIIFEALSGILTIMSPPGVIVGRVLLHIGIHLIGLHLYTQWTARKRSTFLRVGQSILSRHRLKEDQSYKQNMIQSLMPKSVADSVMESRNAADKEAECRGPSKGNGPRGSQVSAKGEMKFRDFHMSQMENTSILFADIVGFTKMSSGKQASQLVFLLNDLFGRFDDLCIKTGCEKISTLGDCYYCVSGCPEARDDHAVCCIEMGLFMCKAILQFDKDHNEEVGMRVGVHTGTVLCGLVGTRRFKFDVWSNDVTLANSMESEGEPGRVHISESTHGFIKDLYEVEPWKEVPDIRHHKVLIEEYNKDSQQYQIRHTQKQAVIKTFLVVDKIRTGSGSVSPTSPSSDHNQTVDLPVTSPVQIVVDVPTPEEPSTEEKSSVVEEPASEAKSEDSDSKEKLVNGGQGDAGTNGTVAVSADTSLLQDICDSDKEVKSEETKEEDTDHMKETALLKQLKAQRSRSIETDQQMVELMSAERNIAEYLHRPPIGHLTLTFNERSYERYFRRHYLDCDMAANRTLTMPRLAALIDILVSITFLILLSVGLFVGLPLSIVWVVVFVIVLMMEVVMLIVVITDLKSQGKSTGVRGLINKAASWAPRHAFGAILTCIPIIAVYANFSCRTLTGGVVDAYFCVLMLASLVHFCNFTMLSSWMKSSLAILAGAILITLVLVGVCPPDQDIISDTTTVAGYSAATPTAEIIVNLNETAQAFALFNGLHSMRWEVIINVLLLLLLIIFLNREFEISYRLSFYGEQQAERDQRKMNQEKEQADWLLHNIIPKHVTQKLSTEIETTSKSCYSRDHTDVGVVFAKVTNFEDFYDESFEGGREYYRVLNELISDMEDLFDDSRFKDVEKIKTIGSCLMVASGLNEQRRVENNDPIAHLYALMEFCEGLYQRLEDFNSEIFNFDFEMMIGFNHGPVTAGVIGTTKLFYDIWGDAVNVSSRMYSTGMAGRIQVTKDCADKLEPKFDFEYRDEIFVKGKGNVKTYLHVKRKEGAVWD